MGRPVAKKSIIVAKISGFNAAGGTGQNDVRHRHVPVEIRAQKKPG